MRKLIILFASITLILCDKLSESEDQKRAERCGRIGKDVGTEAPPWAVRIHVASKEDDPNRWRSSATMISQRHVLAHGSDVIKQAGNGTNKYEWVHGTRMEMGKECKDGVIEMPKKLLKNYKILLSTCKNVDVCGTDILRKVVRGWFIGSCEPVHGVFGMALMEISSNVPKDSEYFRPVCMPAEKKSPSVGSSAFFHSSGDASLDSKVDGLIKWTDSKITKCTDHRRLISMICASHNSCGGDEGGAIVQKIDDKDTVMGILTLSARDCKKKAENDQAISTGYFREKICELAGICKTAVTVSSADEFNVVIAVMIALIMMI